MNLKLSSYTHLTVKGHTINPYSFSIMTAVLSCRKLPKSNNQPSYQQSLKNLTIKQSLKSYSLLTSIVISLAS